MSLTRCRHCRRQTSRLADECYFCGRPLRRSTRWLRLTAHLTAVCLAGFGYCWFVESWLGFAGGEVYLAATEAGGLLFLLIVDGIWIWWAESGAARRAAALNALAPVRSEARRRPEVRL